MKMPIFILVAAFILIVAACEPNSSSKNASKDTPKSTLVADARRIYEEALQKALEKSNATRQAAKDESVKELQAALDTALNSKDLNASNTIAAMMKSITALDTAFAAGDYEEVNTIAGAMDLWAEPSVLEDATSSVVERAIQTYKASILAAQGEYQEQVSPATTSYLSALETALDVAFAEKDLEEANRINAVIQPLRAMVVSRKAAASAAAKKAADAAAEAVIAKAAAFQAAADAEVKAAFAADAANVADAAAKKATEDADQAVARRAAAIADEAAFRMRLLRATAAVEDAAEGILLRGEAAAEAEEVAVEAATMAAAEKVVDSAILELSLYAKSAAVKAATAKATRNAVTTEAAETNVAAAQASDAADVAAAAAEEAADAAALGFLMRAQTAAGKATAALAVAKAAARAAGTATEEAVEEEAVAEPSLPVIQNSIGMSFKLLPRGPIGSFSIGVHEVTQAQFEKVMLRNSSYFKGVEKPVEQVCWDDAVAFCVKMSALPVERAAGRAYRLPTEAEWEYACRAGTRTEYSFGEDPSKLRDYAWFARNSSGETRVVGTKLPNAWGLYDMHGNVFEWCKTNVGSSPVYRGGSWCDDAANCRVERRVTPVRTFCPHYGGFRVVLNLAGQ